MESSSPKPAADQNLANPGTPVAAAVEPPPLPQQIQRFRVACWIGLVSGGLWALFGGVGLLITLWKPMTGVLTSLPMFVLPPVALTQSLTAYLLLKGRRSVLQIFCASSILAALVISFGSIVFGALNVVPVILLMWSAGSVPNRPESREKSETSPTIADLSTGPSTAGESRADIY